MKYSLKTKVTAFITATVVIISLVSTIFFTISHKKSIEKEIIARGRTMSESLSKAVDEGLAAENLDFIKNVQDIVHTKDVVLAQIFTEVWLPVDSFPLEQFTEPPDTSAQEHFKSSIEPFHLKSSAWFDFYAPIFYERVAEHKTDIDNIDKKKYLIGFVRLRVSTDHIKSEIRDTVRNNIILSLILTAVSAFAINAFIRRNMIKPIMKLHLSASMHRQGELPVTVSVSTSDEIGELASEFNRMTVSIRDREEKIQEEKERLSVTLRSIGDAVIVTDIHGTITMINRVAEQHTGWQAEEAAGRPLSEVFNIINEKTRERCENPVAKVIETGLVQGLANHTALIRRDGSEIIIEDSAAPIRDRSSQVMGVVLVFRDMTDRKRMEEELLKADKLQSVGILAGGLAHDFNNLLTSIVGNISMAKMFIHDQKKTLERLNDAETASKRATDLTYQLLTFSKGGAPVKKTEAILEIIREASGFALSGTNVAAEYVVPETPWPVDIDAGQISQVFNNLTINSVQAMPEGGMIVYTVLNMTLSFNQVATLREGAYVHISIKDNGTGIAQDHLGKIFDPYFTTKQKGSGLGLASVYSIIKNHDGHIMVESALGMGTTFNIYIPASVGKTGASSQETPGISKGAGRVLVMDDEKLIRDIAGQMLGSLGYDVTLARDGSEAVDLYRAAIDEEKPFDAAILDLTIPGGMGGKDAAQNILEIDPDAKVIVSSGYSNDPVMSDYRKYGFKGVVIKPYNIGTFSKALRDALKSRN